MGGLFIQESGLFDELPNFGVLIYFLTNFVFLSLVWDTHNLCILYSRIRV